MDFLDRIALFLSPRRSSPKSSNSEGMGAVVNKHEVIIPKDYRKHRASFAEKNFSKPEKIYNDNFVKENPYKAKGRWSKDMIDKILPFLNEKQDWAEWTYRNRYGVFTTVGLYLAVLLGFSMVNFNVTKSTLTDGILIELEKLEKLEEELQKLEQMQQQAEANGGSVSNEVSDVNSNTKEDYADKAYEKIDNQETVKLLDKALEDHMTMREGMRAYIAKMDHLDLDLEKESRNARKQRDSMRVAKENESTFSKKKGNVTVSYDLKDRRALYLEMPAYLCEGGGKIVLDIVVNRMGSVVNATVRSTQGVEDPCIQETAIWAAKNSQFDVNNSSESRQAGTMTYIFIAQ